MNFTCRLLKLALTLRNGIACGKICLHTTGSSFLSVSKLTRPPTSFGLFVQDRKDSFSYEKNVGGSLFKYAALEWKKLPFPEKEEYAMRAQKAMSLYKESLNSLTDFERDEMKKEKAQEKVERAKRRQKKMKIALGRPKLAINPYRYFIKHLFETKEVTRRGKHMGTVMREVSVKWENLPFEEKEKYIELHRQDQERYMAEMETYVRRLRKEGHEPLIPKKYQDMWLEPKQNTSWESIVNTDWPRK